MFLGKRDLYMGRQAQTRAQPNSTLSKMMADDVLTVYLVSRGDLPFSSDYKCTSFIIPPIEK